MFTRVGELKISRLGSCEMLSHSSVAVAILINSSKQNQFLLAPFIQINSLRRRVFMRVNELQLRNTNQLRYSRRNFVIVLQRILDPGKLLKIFPEVHCC